LKEQKDKKKMLNAEDAKDAEMNKREKEEL